MSVTPRSLLALLPLLALAAPSCMKPQGKVAGVAMSSGAGLRGEILYELGFLEKKVLRLLDAIPQEKLTWRPADDMRTAAGIFVHLGNAPFFIAGMMGVGDRPSPASFKAAREAEKSMTDKAAIKAHLERGFAHQRKAIEGFSDAKLEEMVKAPWGTSHSKRFFMGILPRHLHSHLGQLGIYARMVGITPPWVLEEKKKREEMMKKMMLKKGAGAGAK